MVSGGGIRYQGRVWTLRWVVFVYSVIVVFTGCLYFCGLDERTIL